MRRLFAGSYQKRILSTTTEEEFYILRSSSTSRDDLIRQLSCHLSSTYTAVTYNRLPPVLVIELTKEADAEADIVLTGFDLTGVCVNKDADACLRYDLYALCLYNAKERHYRAVTYSSCLNKWILYESQCVTVLQSFGSSNKFRSSESYLLFYKQENLPWPIPTVTSRGKTSDTPSSPTSLQYANTSIEQSDQRLSTPISLHTRTSKAQSADSPAQTTTLASPFHEHVLPSDKTYTRIRETTLPEKKPGPNIIPKALCPHCMRGIDIPHYRRHMRSHRKALSKQQNVNSSNADLTNPMSSMQYPSQMVCSIDGYSTTSRKLWLRHNRRQHSTAKYQCSLCDKRFRRFDHLRSHLLHAHKNPGPYTIAEYVIDTDKEDSELSEDTEDENTQTDLKSYRVLRESEPFPAMKFQPGYKGPMFTAPPKKID